MERQAPTRRPRGWVVKIVDGPSENRGVGERGRDSNHGAGKRPDGP